MSDDCPICGQSADIKEPPICEHTQICGTCDKALNIPEECEKCSYEEDGTYE
ncbi:MAG: hypothetical protein ACKN9R_05165 [Candidatus Limnocylindrus sp.]